MHLKSVVRGFAPCLAAAIAVLLWPEPAPAQARGMMMPMTPSMPGTSMSGGTNMMRPATMTSNSRSILLLALRQREMILLTALRQVDVQMSALEMRPATAQRNALMTVLQQRQFGLSTLLRQVAEQIAALQG